MKTSLPVYLTLTVLSLFPIFPENAISQTDDLWRITPFAGLRGYHQNGGFAGIQADWNSLLGVSVSYGKDDLNSVSGSVIWFPFRGEPQLFLKGGVSQFWSPAEDDYRYRLRSVHLGAGYQAVFWDHWVAGTDATVVKYVRQSFKIEDLKIKESFSLDETYFFRLGLTLGYRFSF